LDPNIDSEDIGDMPNLDAITIRKALALDGPYPDGGGPCPDDRHEASIYSYLNDNWA
jgi:hypothetical protein